MPVLKDLSKKINDNIHLTIEGQKLRVGINKMHGC